MAEIETLPLDKLPPLAVTRADAEWEQKFKRPAPKTSLAQRHWENKATLANAANELTRADAAIQERLMTDQTAQNFYFKSQELPMDLERHNSDMEFRREKFEHDKAMFPITMAQRKAATIAAMGRTEAMARGSLWKEELHAQEAKDTVGFTEYVRGLGHKRGTPDFANSLADARLKFPAMDHTLFQDVWKTHSGQELDPDEALKRFQETVNALPGDTVAAKLPGGINVTSRPENPASTVDARQADLQLRSTLIAYEKEQAKEPEKRSPAILAQYERNANGLRAKLGIAPTYAHTAKPDGEVGAPAVPAAPSAAAPERTVVNPTTGERLVLRNGAWVKP